MEIQAQRFYSCFDTTRRKGQGGNKGNSFFDKVKTRSIKAFESEASDFLQMGKERIVHTIGLHTIVSIMLITVTAITVNVLLNSLLQFIAA